MNHKVNRLLQGNYWPPIGLHMPGSRRAETSECISGDVESSVAWNVFSSTLHMVNVVALLGCSRQLVGLPRNLDRFCLRGDLGSLCMIRSFSFVEMDLDRRVIGISNGEMVCPSPC